MSQPDPTPRRHYRAAGTAALLIVGLLILVPSGLCTGAFGIGAVLELLTNPQNADTSMLGMALIFGGPFVAVGGVLVWIAIRRMRAR